MTESGNPLLNLRTFSWQKTTSAAQNAAVVKEFKKVRLSPQQTRVVQALVSASPASLSAADLSPALAGVANIRVVVSQIKKSLGHMEDGGIRIVEGGGYAIQRPEEIRACVEGVK